MADWDPRLYQHFGDERSRPFFELIGRVDAERPAHIVDLGCGPGSLTQTMTDRWPDAQICGVDSSAAMIEAASVHAADRLRFELGDMVNWQPTVPVDLIVSNAALQWVPGHLEMLPRLVEALAPDGWLAFQVPGNFDEPSHRLLHDLAADTRFAEATRQVERPSAHGAATYLAGLAVLGCRVDAWETTYLHVLRGEDPVFTWISGTGARPILQALPDHKREAFESDYKALLSAAYPTREFGTVLPFRRVFVVAQKAAA